MHNNSIFVARTVPSPADSAFEAWISPQTLVELVTKIESDATPGGRLTMWAGDPKNVMRGRFVQVERSARLRYTWRWDADPEETVIEVGFEEIDDGATLIEVTHAGFLTDSSMNRHLEGWTAYFDGLLAHLG